MLFEVHQIEGFDWDSRMFSRDVRVEVDENGYFGTFSYEGIKFKTESYPTVDEVLSDATRRLHKKGFTDLRTRVNVREDRYLAERENWVDHKNPK
ncbi:MAG: hypothetical protein ACE5F7_07355 [Nitrospiria bacterium]